MRSATRIAAATGIGALVIAGTAACGAGNGAGSSAAKGTGGTATSGHIVQTAYAATRNEKTASFRFEAAIHNGSPQASTITGQGQTDFSAKAFTATVNLPIGGTLKVLLVHGIEYIQIPGPARSRLPGNSKWLSVNLNKVSQAKLGESFGQFSSASTSDPSQALSQLAAVSSGVTKVGTATVAGVPTTEYRANVNLSKLAARVQSTQGAKAAQAIRREISELGRTTVPVQMWIDAHHLVRQIRYQVPIPRPGTTGTGGQGTVESTITFTHFGAPVRLSVPPASQTTDITGIVLRHANASS